MLITALIVLAVLAVAFFVVGKWSLEATDNPAGEEFGRVIASNQPSSSQDT